MTTIETEEINENHIYKGIRLHVTAQLDTARQRNPTLLEKAIHAMLKNRRTIYEENHPLFNDDFPINPRFPMLQKSFMKKIRKAKPDFETVVRLIKEKLFPYWEKYKEQQNAIVS